MGGDSGPAIIVAGIARALRADKALCFDLYGDESLIAPELARFPALAGAVTASAGCSTPGVTVSIPASTTLVVPAGGNASLSVANGIAMTTASSSNCQGATFTIPLQATGRLS